jgi:peptide chain release factor 3
MKATDARTGERLSLNYAHELFGQERSTVDEAYPGNVVGLVSGADIRVGDTLFEATPVEFPPFRILAPERFAAARNRDTSRYKQFRSGLAQLEQEGVVHVLHRPEVGAQAPILAGIGPMQFEGAAHRMANEFGAEVELEPLGWSLSRLIGAGDAAAVQSFVWGEVLEDSVGRKLAVFRKEFELERFARDHPEIALDRFIAGA